MSIYLFIRIQYKRSVFLQQYQFLNIRLATKWLRILPLGGIDKSRNHLVANLINERAL